MVKLNLSNNHICSNVSYRAFLREANAWTVTETKSNSTFVKANVFLLGNMEHMFLPQIHAYSLCCQKQRGPDMSTQTLSGSLLLRRSARCKTNPSLISSSHLQRSKVYTPLLKCFTNFFSIKNVTKISHSPSQKKITNLIYSLHNSIIWL